MDGINGRFEGSDAGREELERLRARISKLRAMDQELIQALCAGREAMRAAKEALKHLDHAMSFGVWDFLGGGMFAGMAKHSALKGAQEKLDELRRTLERFRSEMADVRVSVDAQARIGDALHFADYVFDGWLVDFLVLDKIGQSKKRVEQTQGQIAEALNQLGCIRRSLDGEICALQEQVDRFSSGE